MKTIWEKIYDHYEYCDGGLAIREICSENMYRVKVYKGWLVKTFKTGEGTHIVFIPDANHTWNGKIESFRDF